MRIVIQRVSTAQVSVNKQLVNKINHGYLILVGVGHMDTAQDVEWLVNKVANLRVFADENGKMNLNIRQVSGSILAISQFTLHASTAKGNRPSFTNAAAPELANLLYENFIHQLNSLHGIPTFKGVFGADMQVELLNDGPVTLWMDSKQKE